MRIIITNPFLIAFFLMLSAPLSAELNLKLPTQNSTSKSVHASNYTSSTVQSNRGLSILRKLRSSGNLIEDPELNTWIRSIGNRLTASASHSSAPFYFVISRSHDINAFATMGGVIVVNTGLILATDSESELAAALAHEIAHITQRHIDRMLAKAKGRSFATGAAVLAGILASSKDPQAGQAIINTAMATMAHKQLAFTREAEAEADRVGIRILASSGFNPQAMPSFLKKLESFNNGKYAGIQEFLQNHPLTHKRVTDTQIRAKKFGGYKKRSSNAYLYMREKLRALSNSPTNPTKHLPATIKKYSKAMRLYQKGNYKLALKLLGQQTRKAPEAILISKLLNKQKKFNESIKLLSPLLRTYPEETSLTIPLVQAYIATGQVHKAWKILNEVQSSELTSLEYFEIKQQTARLIRNTSQAYFASANQNIRIGAYKTAEIQLKQAIKSPGSSYSDLQEIQSVLEQIKNQKQ